MKRDFIIIMVTCGSGKEAAAIANHLLKERLVACANIINSVKSKFWWEDRIEKADEAILLLKTKSCNFKPIEREIKRLHSYEVPEIIAMPILKGSKNYLNWLDLAVKRCRDS